MKRYPGLAAFVCAILMTALPGLADENIDSQGEQPSSEEVGVPAVADSEISGADGDQLARKEDVGSFRKKVVIEDKAVVDDAVMKTAKEFEALHKAGKWKEAQELMDRLIARDPKFAAEALGAVLRRRQIATRSRIISSIGDAKLTEAIPVLKEMLSDPEETIRTRSAIALCELGDRSGVRVLEHRLEAELDWHAAHRIRVALAKLGEPYLQYFIDGLSDRNEGLRRRCMSALGEIQDGRAVPYLMKMLDSKDIWEPWNAAYAITRITGIENCTPAGITMNPDGSICTRMERRPVDEFKEDIGAWLRQHQAEVFRVIETPEEDWAYTPEAYLPGLNVSFAMTPQEVLKVCADAELDCEYQEEKHWEKNGAKHCRPESIVASKSCLASLNKGLVNIWYGFSDGRLDEVCILRAGHGDSVIEPLKRLLDLKKQDDCTYTGLDGTIVVSPGFGDGEKESWSIRLNFDLKTRPRPPAADKPVSDTRKQPGLRECDGTASVLDADDEPKPSPLPENTQEKGDAAAVIEALEKCIARAKKEWDWVGEGDEMLAYVAKLEEIGDGKAVPVLKKALAARPQKREDGKRRYLVADAAAKALRSLGYTVVGDERYGGYRILEEGEKADPPDRPRELFFSMRSHMGEPPTKEEITLSGVLQQAGKLRREKKYHEAVKCLREFISTCPDEFSSMKFTGYVYLMTIAWETEGQVGDTKAIAREAVGFLTSAIGRHGGEDFVWDVYESKGSVEFGFLEDFEQAAISYGRAIELFPEELLETEAGERVFLFAQRLGESLGKSKGVESEVEVYREWRMKKIPDLFISSFWYYEGKALFSSGDIDGARKALEEARKGYAAAKAEELKGNERRNASMCAELLARILLKQKKYKEAIGMYGEAAAFDEMCRTWDDLPMRAKVGIGSCYVGMGKADEAKESFDEARDAIGEMYKDAKDAKIPMLMLEAEIAWAKGEEKKAGEYVENAILQYNLSNEFRKKQSERYVFKQQLERFEDKLGKSFSDRLKPPSY